MLEQRPDLQADLADLAEQLKGWLKPPRRFKDVRDELKAFETQFPNAGASNGEEPSE